MSDFQDYFNENDGFQGFLGNAAAIGQRNMQLSNQRQQIAVLEKQYAEMQRSAAAQLAIDQQRLALEQLRAKAEAEERAFRQEQERQLKQIRNFMADTIFALEQLKKQCA